ncbi:MAG: hypothetical protein IT532_14980 [Burkholderiales bacterium]|nr:hypothetical protein [Burkholderiales bacterium]
MRNRSSLLLLAGVMSIQVAFAQAPAPDIAAVEAQTRRVEVALVRLQAEQQSLYQQFQMIQGLRDGLLREMQQATQIYTPEATPPSYDEMIARRTGREDRLNGYTDELDRLYDRYREIEDLKRPLLEELSALARAR